MGKFELQYIYGEPCLDTSVRFESVIHKEAGYVSTDLNIVLAMYGFSCRTGTFHWNELTNKSCVTYNYTLLFSQVDLIMP